MSCFSFRRKPRLLLEQDPCCDSSTSKDNATLSEVARGSPGGQASCSVSHLNAGKSANGNAEAAVLTITRYRDQGNDGSPGTISPNVVRPSSSKAPNGPKLVTRQNSATRHRTSFSSLLTGRGGQTRSVCRWLFSVCDPLQARDVVESSDDDGRLSPTSVRTAVPRKQKRLVATTATAVPLSTDHKCSTQADMPTVPFPLQKSPRLQHSDMSRPDVNVEKHLAPLPLRSTTSCDQCEAATPVQPEQLNLTPGAVPGPAAVVEELSGLTSEPSRRGLDPVRPECAPAGAPEAAHAPAPAFPQTPACSPKVASPRLSHEREHSPFPQEIDTAPIPAQEEETPRCSAPQSSETSVLASISQQLPSQTSQPTTPLSECPHPARASWMSKSSEDSSVAELSTSRDSCNVSTRASSSPDSDCRLSSASMSSALSVIPDRLENPTAAAVSTQAPQPSATASVPRTPTPSRLPRANTTEALMGTPTVSEDGATVREYQSSPFANVHLRHTPQYPRRSGERSMAQVPLTWEERYMLRSQRMYSSGMDGIRNQTYIPDTRNFTEDCAEELFDRILQRRMSLDLQGIGV